MTTTESRNRFAKMRSLLRLPVVCAPMFLVSGPELVVSACRAGIVGSFPAPNALTIDIFEEWLDRITGELAISRKRPVSGGTDIWAMNLVVHSTYERLEKELVLIEKYRPPIVITALGSPTNVVEIVHGYGGLVIADVNSVEFARKAAAVGVDGLALICSGAGGHTGKMAGFAFVPAVREFFDGILILAGAIGDGRAVRAAEVLGADLCYLGTRFIAAKESIAVEDYKQMVVESDFSDLILSNSFTGAYAYFLRSSIVAAGLDPDKLVVKDGMNLTGVDSKVDAWRDVWSAGQGVGTVHGVEPVAKIVERMEREYLEARSVP